MPSWWLYLASRLAAMWRFAGYRARQGFRGARRLRVPGGRGWRRTARWGIPAVVGIAVAASIVLAVVTLAAWSAVALRDFERAEARRATYVLAAGQLLTTGVHVGAIELAGTLARLGYTEIRQPPTTPGQFQRTKGAWELVLRGDATHPGGRVRLELNGERIARVLRDGKRASTVMLEPETLTSVGDRPGEEYRPVRLADVPPVVIAAFLAAEDHRFFEHRGVDIRGLFRAAWVNLRHGRIAQGGSTVTQQLVKTRLLNPQRTFMRKAREAWLAALVEWHYPKERILESYFNEIYLGQRGGLAVRGLGAAARSYFGKEVHQLSVADGALLAGITRAPNSYAPATQPERARERRDVVLGQMQALGWIAEADARAAKAEPLRIRPAGGGGQPAPYYTDAVRQEIDRELGEEAAGVAGLRIETALDLALQRFAERAVTRGLERLEARHPKLRRRGANGRIQAALVALDHATGQVRAMVGGRDYGDSQFNRAVLARRQPGSAFKPFVFAAALTRRGGAPRLTAASLVDDEPLTISVNGQTWTPRNYEDRYEGRVTVRRALEASLNSATIRIAQTAGLDAVVETARSLGVTSPLTAVPAAALGSFEVTPLELARAYAAIANGGARPRGPALIRAVRFPDGTTTTFDDATGEPVLSPAEAYLLTSLMIGVMRSGTGASEGVRFGNAAVAGKTGTTNDGRDAWFVGYTPTLLAVVWVGFDDGEPHALSGSEAALPIWADFVRQAIEAYPSPAFDVPPGVTILEVDGMNGKRANKSCPLIVRETFLAGTEPALCEEHGGAGDQILDWWRRFREWWRR